jgi:DNA-binding MarR family transcriptional regulator
MIRTVNEELERQLQRDAQITHASYQVLVALSEHQEDALRMSDLAVRLAWSQSRLSHVMAWLERSGWVRRSPCPTDKRSSLAQLTAKGRQKLAESAPGHVAAVRHLVIDALTGDQQRALAQISEAITARADTPAP